MDRVKERLSEDQQQGKLGVREGNMDGYGEGRNNCLEKGLFSMTCFFGGDEVMMVVVGGSGSSSE